MTPDDASFDALGMRSRLAGPAASQARVSYVMSNHVLKRILNFTGHSIDDVINNPVARNKVRVYFRLHKFIQHGSEISELERQWNPLG